MIVHWIETSLLETHARDSTEDFEEVFYNIVWWIPLCCFDSSLDTNHKFHFLISNFFTRESLIWNALAITSRAFSPGIIVIMANEKHVHKDIMERDYLSFIGFSEVRLYYIAIFLIELFEQARILILAKYWTLIVILELLSLRRPKTLVGEHLNGVDATVSSFLAVSSAHVSSSLVSVRTLRPLPSSSSVLFMKITHII